VNYPMYHPTTRLLTVLELLQNHEQLSSNELATRLEVNVRTVRRYILMLQDLGIPIEAEMGRHGGYSLRPGFKLPPMMFNNEEVLALVLGLLVVRHLGVSMEACSLEGAMAKLKRVLPDTLREQTEALQHALIFAMSPTDQQVEGSILGVLGQAVHDARSVTIGYQTKGEETEREVDPYGLVYHDAAWYLIGYCHLRADIRVFRLDRMTHVTLRNDGFTFPENFDSLAYLIQSIATMPDRWTIEVILNTTLATAAQHIPEGMGILRQDTDGVLFHTAVGDMDWMARFLMNLGIPFRVCHPPELKTALKKLAGEMLHYAQA